MARPELGVKRICPTTGKKFYDMGRDPVISPYTGESFPRAQFEPVRRSGAPVAAPKAAPQPAADEDAELEPQDAELISLEEADDEAADTGAVEAAGDDIDIEDAGDDDTFLPVEDEDEGEDVEDLIGEGIEDEDEQ